MILSNVRIHDALDKGWLIITPEPAPRRKTTAEIECPYQTTAIDLRLGNEIAYFKRWNSRPTSISAKAGSPVFLARTQIV